MKSSGGGICGDAEILLRSRAAIGRAGTEGSVTPDEDQASGKPAEKTKYIILYNDDDKCQWVSNGVAAYPLHNMPWLDEETLFAIFDVPADKRDKYTFRSADLSSVALDFSDNAPQEKVLERDMLQLCMDGREVEPLKSTHGIIFLDTQFLKPFADEQSMELYERCTKSGETYIAVKSGLLLLGVIMPMKVLNDTFVEMLTELTNLSIYQWEQEKQQKEAGTWHEQQTFWNDEGEREDEK